MMEDKENYQVITTPEQLIMASQMGVQFHIVEDSNNEFNFPSPPASSSFAAADSNSDVIITNEIIPDSLTQSFEEESEAGIYLP